MKNYILMGLVALSVTFFGLWRCSASTAARATANVEALLDTAAFYTVRDSLSAASVAALTLTVGELGRYRASDARLIADLNLRLRRVNSIATVATVGRYEFAIKASPQGIFHYTNPYVDFSARLSSDTLASSVVVRDTIVQVLHRVPKFKIFGIMFGTKGVRQEVVSKNPYVRISYASYVEIKK